MGFSWSEMARAARIMTPRPLRGGVLGIDIGTSAVKVVQLGLSGGKPALETYGDISLARYGAQTLPGRPQLQPDIEGNALADLLQEIRASSRVGGIALSQAATLTSVVELPKRDEEQMRKIIGVEAQQFIPVPMESVTLDWVVIPEASAGVRAFDQLEDPEGIQARKQKVLLVASERIASDARMKAAQIGNVAPSFAEVEMFSLARACRAMYTEPACLIDLGASAAKICIADERGMPVAAHLVPGGGEAVTSRLAASLDCETLHAEEAKRAFGTAAWEQLPGKERETIAAALADHAVEVFSIADTMIAAHAKDHVRRISRIIVSGGGSAIFIPEICARMREKFAVEVIAAEPFAQIATPMILSDAIKRAGSRFAVAIGLALRALYA